MRRYHFLTLVPIAREQVFDSLEDAVVVIDALGYVADVNPAACRVLDKDAQALVGSRAARMLDEQTTLGGGPEVLARLRGELILQKPDGPRYFEVRSSPVTGQSGADRIVVLRDVTERENAARLLEHQALYDALTDLPNRALLRDRLQHAIQHGGSLALLLLDLDRFKEVNDTLGHQAGDQLLQQVANRLRGALRTDDTAARLGGDEFAVLLEHVGSQDEAVAVAERLLSSLRAPLILGGRELSIGLSIGVALSGTGTVSSEDLMRQADLALYSAKAGGRGTYAVFEPGLETLAVERLEIENDLRQALDRHELWLAYQPILNLESGAVGEMEALLRWEHPRRGAMSPAAFIPVAEETGLIVPIGQWVLEEACRQVRAWHAEYPTRARLVMSVNLSGRQFRHPGLVADVARTLAETGIDPQALKLEITESVLMQDVEAAVQTCMALKALGVQLAIDDFGTGYSSLGQLKRLPFDTLKIDRSFVDGLGRDEQDMAIVRSVVTLAKTLGLSVTAEGVESPIQEAHLRSLGCERGQGFLFARPQRSESVSGLLAEAPAAHELRAA